MRGLCVGGVAAFALAIAVMAGGCSDTAEQVGPSVDAQLTINEVQAVNVLSSKDDSGAASAWLEIYNPTTHHISLAGYGLTDFLATPNKTQLPEGASVPAHGHLVVWCNGGNGSLQLSRAGGTIGFSRPDGSYIDRVTFGAQEVDFSVAREPDGSNNWVTEWVVSPGKANPAGSGTPAGAEVESDPPEQVPDPGDLGERFLGYDVISEIELQISSPGIAALRAAPDQWTEATLIYGGRKYGPVAVNLKGTASFQPIDQKPAFRVNIDKIVKDARFFGLKEFLVNNMTTDPSMMHERLGYWAARLAGGVPASRSNHAMLKVNGKSYGLYAIVEEPKLPLMSRYYPDPGSVYTIHYADFVQADLASFQLQDGPDDSALITALSQALTLTPPDAAMTAAQQVIDMHEFNRYWALSAITGHWGGWPYAPAGEPAGANAGTFADPVTKKLYFIPEGINDDFTTADFDFIKQVKSVLPSTCMQTQACSQDFIGQVWEILGKLEQTDWGSEQARVAAQIAPYVAKDPRKPYSDADVAEAQKQMGYFISGRRTQMATVIPPPGP
jgi:hypothetical protein